VEGGGKIRGGVRIKKIRRTKLAIKKGERVKRAYVLRDGGLVKLLKIMPF